MSRRPKGSSPLPHEVGNPSGAPTVHQVPAGQLAFTASQNVRISPFPPPAEMQVYEQLAPGFTAEFLGTYKSQVEHRQKLESLAIAGDNTRANRAQVLSFILAIVFGILGFSLILLGKDIVGYATLLGAIGSLLLAFFGGTFMRYLERKSKDRSVKK